MSSICYGGSICMNPEIENKKFEGGYPHKIPKVFLDGCGEEYYPQYCFNWDDDSVVIRDKHVVKYTHSSFVELLAKNEDGEIVWMDARSAPYSGCWGGEYLDESRPAYEYIITEYNLEELKKRTYKVVLEEESCINNLDLDSLSKFGVENTHNSHFEIKDGILLQYVGKDRDIVIPEGVKEISPGALWHGTYPTSIKIPNTVEKIPVEELWCCNCKNIEIAADNPRYLLKDGLVIDKVTQTLMWSCARSVIPNDGSIKKIATCDRNLNVVIKDVESSDPVLEVKACYSAFSPF